MAATKRPKPSKAVKRTPPTRRPPASRSAVGAQSLKAPAGLRGRVHRLLKNSAGLTPHQIANQEGIPLGVVADILILLLGTSQARPSPGVPGRFIAI